MDENKKYRKPKCQPNDFWIQITTRDLTTCMDGEGICEEAMYITDRMCGKNDTPLDLTEFFYTALKKYNDLENDGEMFVFDIKAYHSEFFEYTEPNLKVDRTKKINIQEEGE